jgi:hypothetical protein
MYTRVSLCCVVLGRQRQYDEKNHPKSTPKCKKGFIISEEFLNLNRPQDLNRKQLEENDKTK